MSVPSGELPTACTICGSKHLKALGVFVPADPERFGAPVGKARLIVYALCRRHLRERETSFMAIEAHAFESLSPLARGDA